MICRGISRAIGDQKKDKERFSAARRCRRIERQGSGRQRNCVLNGAVRSWAERNDAEHVVWSMPGVTNVENNLEIREM